MIKERKREWDKSRRNQRSWKRKEEILSAIISTAVATPWLEICTVLVLVCIVEETGPKKVSIL